MKKPKHFPSLEVFKEKALTCNVVPVYRDILADTETPVSAFMKIDDGADAFLLESVEGGETWGRYSLLGTEPETVVRGKGMRLEVTSSAGTEVIEGNPIEALQALMSRFRPAQVPGVPRFYGGAIGYMGYDVIRHIERLPDSAKDDLDMPDLFFIYTGTLLVFDNMEHKIKVIANAFIDEDSDHEEAYRRAIEKIDGLVEKLRSGRIPERAEPGPAAPLVTSNFKREDFLAAVERT